MEVASIEQLYQHYLQCPTVITDTRKIAGPCIYFALKGPRFDGNKFAMQALKSGALFAVVDDITLPDDPRLLQVKDVLECLQQLANYHRQHFEIPVIAITGSNGKTTTKELASAVLGSHYPLHFTHGNLNNHIGVPLTLLAMPLQTEVAIIEMGANHQGEIADLCEIAMPTHGLITNIGKAHLEGFGGIEGVRKGKGELFQYLANSNGTAFVNKEEADLEELAIPVKRKIFYVNSTNPSPRVPEFEVKLLSDHPFVKVAFLDEFQDLQEVHSQLIGSYNFNNIATAVTLGKYFKVPGHKIKAAIEAYTPRNNRSQIIQHGTNTFLLDAYNANPTSMALALRTFAKMENPKKIAILGDMLELGISSNSEHQDIVALASQLIPESVFVGKSFGNISETEGRHFENVEALKKWFTNQSFTDTTFLIKGSRGIRLEALLQNDE